MYRVNTYTHIFLIYLLSFTDFVSAILVYEKKLLTVAVINYLSWC